MGADLIIHAGTGTIIPADECRVVTITDDPYPLDHEIFERAEEDGLPISELMTNKINTTHFIFYYDTEMNEADGNGWCVELSNDSTTHRFMQPDHATEFIQNNAGILVAIQESAVA